MPEGAVAAAATMSASQNLSGIPPFIASQYQVNLLPDIVKSLLAPLAHKEEESGGLLAV